MKIKHLISICTFQIGVNIIGLPEFVNHNINMNKYFTQKSKFHK